MARNGRQKACGHGGFPYMIMRWMPDCDMAPLLMAERLVKGIEPMNYEPVLQAVRQVATQSSPRATTCHSYLFMEVLGKAENRLDSKARSTCNLGITLNSGLTVDHEVDQLFCLLP